MIVMEDKEKKDSCILTMNDQMLDSLYACTDFVNNLKEKSVTNGINILFTSGHVQFMATNNNILCLFKHKHANKLSGNESLSLIVSRSFAYDAIVMDEPVKVYVNDMATAVKIKPKGGTFIGHKLLEGKFPKVQDKVKTKGKHALKVGFNMDDLLPIVNKHIKEKKNMQVRIAKGNAYISSTIEGDTDYVEMSVKQDGSDITFGLNPKYLSIIMGLLDDQYITLTLFAPNKAIIIVPEEADAMFVIMPLV